MVTAGTFETSGGAAPASGRGDRAATLLVLILALVYAVFLSTLSIIAHRGLATQMNDLGNADQALWAAAHGDWAMTQSNDLDGELRSRIAIHANLIFWPLSLLYLFWPNPELLLVLGSLASAATGVGLYAFARQRLGKTWWSLVPPLAFWLSPIVHDANLYDFHAITVATALLVWMVWAFASGRLRLGWVLLVLAMLCQEDIPLVTFMVGLFLTLRRSRRHRPSGDGGEPRLLCRPGRPGGSRLRSRGRTGQVLHRRRPVCVAGREPARRAAHDGGPSLDRPGPHPAT